MSKTFFHSSEHSSNWHFHFKVWKNIAFNKHLKMKQELHIPWQKDGYRQHFLKCFFFFFWTEEKIEEIHQHHFYRALHPAVIRGPWPAAGLLGTSVRFQDWLDVGISVGGQWRGLLPPDCLQTELSRFTPESLPALASHSASFLVWGSWLTLSCVQPCMEAILNLFFHHPHMMDDIHMHTHLKG